MHCCRSRRQRWGHSRRAQRRWRRPLAPPLPPPLLLLLLLSSRPQAAQLLLQSLTESLDHQEEGLFSDLGTSGPTWHLADALEAALDDEEQAEDIVQELGMVFVAEARLQVWKARFAALGAEHDETAAAACELHDTIRALPATDS